MSLASVGLLTWAVIAQGLTPYLVQPVPGHVGAPPGALVAVVRSAAGPVVEEPGAYVTAVVEDAQGREVVRFALHDNGQGSDVEAADGVWACDATGAALGPGKYTIKLACQHQGQKFWSQKPVSLTVVRPNTKAGALPRGWWMILVLVGLVAASGALLSYMAWRGVVTLGQRQVIPEDKVWGGLFEAANTIGSLVTQAHQQARSEAGQVAGIAQSLAEALTRCSVIEQKQQVKLGFVTTVISEALEAMGYERVEPERGQVPPRNCETVALETEEVPPGTVAQVLRPGWQKRRGEAIELLQPPLVAVARRPQQTASEGSTE